MDMNFSLPLSAGTVLALVVLGGAGMVLGDMMQTSTVFTMVVPSMVVFAAIVFAIGVKHGEYRAT